MWPCLDAIGIHGTLLQGLHFARACWGGGKYCARLFVSEATVSSVVSEPPPKGYSQLASFEMKDFSSLAAVGVCCGPGWSGGFSILLSVEFWVVESWPNVQTSNSAKVAAPRL